MRYRCKNQAIGEKRKAKRQWLVGTSVKTGLVFLIAIFGVLYVAQMSAASTTGYVISDLQKQSVALEQETRAIDVEIAKYGSMASIQERLTALDLVAVENVEYVTPVGTVVARR